MTETGLPSLDTRRGREKRQEMDDGHPEDTVYFLPYFTPQSGREYLAITREKVTHGRAYHEDPDCQYLDGQTKVRSGGREDAQKRGRGPCAICVLGETRGGNIPSHRDCPFCGKEVYTLPGHLPCPEQ